LSLSLSVAFLHLSPAPNPSTQGRGVGTLRRPRFSPGHCCRTMSSIVPDSLHVCVVVLVL
ncbi:hypothetical protein NEUTE2DRAFT_35287, partial [Neurospora tetrasperma FGSC 2509]